MLRNLRENACFAFLWNRRFWFHDFDNTGTLDIVLGYYNDHKCYPLRGRECSSQQMPFIKEKFKDYAAFALATLDDVYGQDLNTALHYEAQIFSSAILENKQSSLSARRTLRHFFRSGSRARALHRRRRLTRGAAADPPQPAPIKSGSLRPGALVVAGGAFPQAGS